MKKTLFYLFCLIISQSCLAQNSTHSNNVSAGIGYSLTGFLFSNFVPDSVELVPTSKASRPSIQIAFDRRISKRLSLGIAYSNQQYELKSASGQTIVFLDHTLNPDGKGFSAKIGRTNLGLRLLFHYMDHDKIDVYSGVRVGWSHWKKDVTSEVAGSTSKKFSNNFVAPQFIPLGIRYYLIKDLMGLGFELGVGAPHFLNLTANCRF